jgi:hypothetical protein
MSVTKYVATFCRLSNIIQYKADADVATMLTDNEVHNADEHDVVSLRQD